MQEIKFNINVNEAQAIMTALAQMPYAQVAELIAKLQQQAQAQLNPAPAAE